MARLISIAGLALLAGVALSNWWHMPPPRTVAAQQFLAERKAAMNGLERVRDHLTKLKGWQPTVPIASVLHDRFNYIFSTDYLEAVTRYESWEQYYGHEIDFTRDPAVPDGQEETLPQLKLAMQNLLEMGGARRMLAMGPAGVVTPAAIPVQGLTAAAPSSVEFADELFVFGRGSVAVWVTLVRSTNDGRLKVQIKILERLE
jgi:hypothetical protein